MTEKPYPGEIAEATKYPDGHIYRVATRITNPNTPVPPEAIVGAWKVGADGLITGDFIPNPKYDAEKYPPGSEI